MRIFRPSWTRRRKNIKVRGFSPSILRDLCVRVERLHYLKVRGFCPLNKRS